MMILREYFICNYMWTVVKLKSLLNKITSPTVESEYSQISINLELLFFLDYSQFENVHFLTVGEIVIIKSQNFDDFSTSKYDISRTVCPIRMIFFTNCSQFHSLSKLKQKSF